MSGAGAVRPETLRRAGVVSFGGAVLGAVANLLLGVVVGRGLGVEDTGLFFQLVGVFVILANVFELGADTGMVRFGAALESAGRAREVPRLLVSAAGPVVVVGVVASAALWLLAPQIGELVAPDHAGTVGSALRLVAPFLVVASVVPVVLGALRGLGDVTPYAAIQNIVIPVGRLVGIGAVLAAGAGLAGASLAWAAPLPIALIVAGAVLVRLLTVRLGPRWWSRREPVSPDSSPRTFWRFSGARAVAAAVEIVLEWVDVLLVGALASPRDAGIYAIVTRAVRAGQITLQAARIAVAPRVSAALAAGDLTTGSRLYASVSQAMVLMSWPLYILLAVFATPVLELFGAGFGEGAVPLAILAAAMLLVTAAGMIQTVLLMGGRSSWQVRNKTLALVVNVTLNLVLIPWAGILGAALAWVATVLAETAVAAVQVHRKIGIEAGLRILAVPAALSLAVFGVAGLGSRWLVGDSLPGLATATLVGGAVYASVVWAKRRTLLADFL